MGLESRPACVMQMVWSKAAQQRLFELKVRHCKGSRIPHWDVIAKELSKDLPLSLTIEDVKSQNKRLVKRLAGHGMGGGSSVKEQLDYLMRYPEAMHTSEDRTRIRLLDWAAEEGFVVAAETVNALHGQGMSFEGPHQGLQAPCPLREQRLPLPASRAAVHVENATKKGMLDDQGGTVAAPIAQCLRISGGRGMCDTAGRMSARTESCQVTETPISPDSATLLAATHIASKSKHPGNSSETVGVRVEPAPVGRQLPDGDTQGMKSGAPCHTNCSGMGTTASVACQEAFDRGGREAARMVMPPLQAVQIQGLAGVPLTIGAAHDERVAGGGSAGSPMPSAGLARSVQEQPGTPIEQDTNKICISNLPDAAACPDQAYGQHRKHGLHNVAVQDGAVDPSQGMQLRHSSGLLDEVHVHMVVQPQLGNGTAPSSPGKAQEDDSESCVDQGRLQHLLTEQLHVGPLGAVGDGNVIPQHGPTASRIVEHCAQSLPRIQAPDAIGARHRRRARICILRVRGQLHAFRTVSKLPQTQTHSKEPKQRCRAPKAVGKKTAKRNSLSGCMQGMQEAAGGCNVSHSVSAPFVLQQSGELYSKRCSGRYNLRKWQSEASSKVAEPDLECSSPQSGVPVDRVMRGSTVRAAIAVRPAEEFVSPSRAIGCKDSKKHCKVNAKKSAARDGVNHATQNNRQVPAEASRVAEDQNACAACLLANPPAEDTGGNVSECVGRSLKERSLAHTVAETCSCRSKRPRSSPSLAHGCVEAPVSNFTRSKRQLAR
jgi:hypothetical protein